MSKEFQIIQCDYCEGTGKIYSNPCGKCKGSGIFASNDDMVVYVEMNANGEVNMTEPKEIFDPVKKREYEEYISSQSNKSFDSPDEQSQSEINLNRISQSKRKTSNVTQTEQPINKHNYKFIIIIFLIFLIILSLFLYLYTKLRIFLFGFSLIFLFLILALSIIIVYNKKLKIFEKLLDRIREPKDFLTFLKNKQHE